MQKKKLGILRVLRNEKLYVFESWTDLGENADKYAEYAKSVGMALGASETVKRT